LVTIIYINYINYYYLALVLTFFYVIIYLFWDFADA